MNPYFAMQHGRKVQLSNIKEQAPHTLAAVTALVADKEIVGQYMLPDPDTGKSDIQMWMPDRVKEAESRIEDKITFVRAELEAIGRGEQFDPRSVYEQIMENRQVPHELTNGHANGHIEMKPGIEYVLTPA